jgi:putative flippase GtrA
MAVEWSGWRRFGVFNLVGLAGFAIQIAVLSALTRIWGWPAALATMVAVEAAVLHNFAGHTRWTWADRPARDSVTRLRRLAAYQGTQAITLAANVALTHLLIHVSPMPVEIANIVAVVALSGVNFLTARAVVFRPTDVTLHAAIPR